MSRSDSEASRKGGGQSVQFRVTGMDCADCVRRAEERLTGLEGVRQAAGNLLSRRMRVEFDPERVDQARIRSELGRLGFLAREDRPDAALERVETWWSARARRTYVSGGLLGLGLLLRVLGAAAAPAFLPAGLELPDLFFLLAAAVGGWNFLPAGVRAARSLSLDMSFLMSVAILGAVAIGEHPEAAAIAFLFSLAELLEEFAVERARGSMQSLMGLSPDAATVLRGGEEVRVPAEEVRVGEEVVVRGGERIPADGAVVEGSSAVDESPITGESVPREKGPGDDVFAGTINAGGYLRIRVTRAAGETTLAGIVRLVTEAEERKAPSERFIERFARRYTPAVTVAALLVAALPPLVFGEPFSVWFLRGLTLLVIACPCALVISTPVAVVSGITAAARQGVLIKGGVHLEAMGRVRAVAFDKTGTLTYGHPQVVEVRPLSGVGEGEVLAAAAAVESRSEHPVGRAIVRAADDRGVPWRELGVAGFQPVAGKGARAMVEGRQILVGSPALFPSESRALELVAPLRRGGRTVVLVGPPEEPLGALVLEDRVRVEAAEAVAALREAGIERVVVLTGDGRETAERVARILGLDEGYGGLLPEEKVARVRELEARYGPVAMVGDGINDGPALRAATVGIAMGAAGSDVALETADIALLADDLSRLPYLYRLSRTGRGVMGQNIAVSLVTKLVLAAGVPFGLVSLVVAVLVGDMGASLAVILNALRLARSPAPEPAGGKGRGLGPPRLRPAMAGPQA